MLCKRESAEDLIAIAPKAKVQMSSDLVLQNTKILEKALRFFEPSHIQIKHGSVGLVVNGRLYEQYGHDDILSKYIIIVDTLLKSKKNVYLLCHASDDLGICSEIKKTFANDQRVVVLNEVLSCFSFENMVRSFEYIVAARYHSIVHSYKECVPCIALGWAVKYQELLCLMGQDEYILDIGHTNDSEIVEAIQRMDMNQKKEREILKQNLKIVQSENCFDELKKRLGEEE